MYILKDMFYLIVKRTLICFSVDFLSSWEKNDVAGHNKGICYVGRIQNADVSSLNIRIVFFTSFKRNIVRI